MLFPSNVLLRPKDQMPDFDKLTPLTQTDAARHQLEKAITLFLTEKDFICAITLAGAADGILGSLVKKRGAKTAHDDHKRLLKKHNHGLTDKELNDLHLNLVRNALKHATEQEGVTKAYALETESIYYITRAIDNHIRLEEQVTEIMKAFIQWVNINRPDLTNPDSEVQIIRP
jgi:hypothetical protein